MIADSYKLHNTFDLRNLLTSRGYKKRCGLYRETMVAIECHKIKNTLFFRYKPMELVIFEKFSLLNVIFPLKFCKKSLQS